MNRLSSDKSVFRILLLSLIAVLFTMSYVSLPQGGETYALGEYWEDCDQDGYDDITGVPMPWVGFDYSAGDRVPDDWDGQTHPYSYYFPQGESGGSTPEGGTDGSGATADAGGSDATADADGSAAISSTDVAAIADRVYTGKAIKPKLKVTVAGKALTENADYSALYVDNTDIGKATVIVTGIGSYRNTVEVIFRIVPKSVKIKTLKAGSKRFSLKWARVSGITKYQVRYKLSAAKKWTTTIAAPGATSKTVTKLKKGKRYQVQIRSYKTVSGSRYYSAWSRKKTVKVK